MSMEVGGDLTLQWVEEVGNVIHEEVICGLEAELDAPVEEVVGACEEVSVEETVETVSEHPESLPVTDADAEILMVPQSNDMESIYIVPQDQGHDYLNIEVTEEVIAESWARSGPEDGMEVPDVKVPHDSLLEYDDMEIPIPLCEQDIRPYPCDFCNKRFKKKASLMSHMMTHSTERPKDCNLCGASFSKRTELANHLKIHAYAPSESMNYNIGDPLGGNEDNFSKNRRKKAPANTTRKRKAPAKQPLNDANKLVMSKWTDQLTTNEPQVQRWPITDVTKPYVCQICGLSFAREKALASHARVHGGDSPFECTSCSEIFWDLNMFNEHMRTKHGLSIGPSEQEESENNFTYTNEEGMGDYTCETCGIPFHRLELLKRHRKTHIKQEIDAIESSSPLHVCNVCGEWFEEALALLAHAESHASRSPSRRCLMCGSKCRDDADLAEHIRENHASTAPPNTCLQCGKTCKDKRSLLKHSWMHNNDKTFSCTKCGKRFHSKARLRRHMMSHRNKMVACDECGEEFPDGRALVSHRHSHNKDLGGRTFPCRECGKTFGSRSSQQIHIRIHTGERPYACRFCWKAFADGGTLRKHERIHTGEKPYGCTICPRAFNQRVVLREHVRAHHSGPDPKCHNSLNPYVCKVCNKAMPTSEELVAHIVAHCDENTALRRQPQSGPRKYKRRRKLKQDVDTFGSRMNESYDLLDGPSDSDENSKRKVAKKTKQRANVAEGYENILKSFESSMQNIDSIVNNSKTFPTKTKTPKRRTKKDDKKNAAGASSASDTPSSSQTGRPKMIHTQKTRVPVALGMEGAKRGQKTKTMVTRTPKVMPNEQHQPPQIVHKPNLLPPVASERNRPRTKNVSYHIDGRQSFAPAVFPTSKLNEDEALGIPSLSTEPPPMEMINVKIEPGLHKFNINQNHITNNNGNIVNFEPKHKPNKAAPKRRAPTKRSTKARKQTAAARKAKGKQQTAMLALPNNNTVLFTTEQHQQQQQQQMQQQIQQQQQQIQHVQSEFVQPTQLFESVTDGNNLEVAYEANVITEQEEMMHESILPDLEKVNNVEDIRPNNNSVKLNVKVESTHDSMLDMHNLMGSVEETVPETIIPDTVEYTCEMCALVFETRNELLLHVPVHI
ncbi:zinc finger protein with KRAB and SCAN domains 7 [Copidosoma floridanum]|uniref:zinc finger protein with KRAB and SCAN domains 7 n=1 Tax=Copidosoma floridanum TaxID=29053 RepID=UPI0006C94FB6|nr:zinc finger protein with KRAB and SCAN domains 7 [Copidosoma floridanum]